MTGRERSIRRELRRSGLLIHACRRTARRLAAQAEGDAYLAALEAFVGRRTRQHGDNLQAARAAQQGDHGCGDRARAARPRPLDRLGA